MTTDGAERLLAVGALTVHGRLTGASNAVLYASVSDGAEELRCVYKPVAGERPLWDFPDGTLAQREVASYEICRALGWDLVPPTVLREGPHGLGMCQQWIGPGPQEGPAGADAEAYEPTDEATDDAADGPAGASGGHDRADDPRAADHGDDHGDGDDHDDYDDHDDREPQLLALVEADEPGPGWKAVGHAQVAPDRTALLVHADDPRLRRLAVLDAVINNADRKGGHLLAPSGRELRAIDHGVTFHTENKLRTLLWGWAGEPLPGEITAALGRLEERLGDGGVLATRMAALITAEELEALRGRVAMLLTTGSHPLPGGDWPAIPWPLI
ncbi:SCO1664 family protein [Streptomyces otsuchiensis]|uniref:SCO1664 family protein n=1 Tax=Streptomyces otsuchiensis TaxID=2681388 RepID=UPI003F689CCD